MVLWHRIPPTSILWKEKELLSFEEKWDVCYLHEGILVICAHGVEVRTGITASWVSNFGNPSPNLGITPASYHLTLSPDCQSETLPLSPRRRPTLCLYDPCPSPGGSFVPQVAQGHHMVQWLARLDLINIKYTLIFFLT